MNIDALWNYDKPAETEARFREVLPEITAGGNLGLRLELETQIARTLGLQRKFEEAHTLLNSVEACLEQGGPRLHIRYLLERGRVFNSSKQPERACPLFFQAWEAACAVREDFYAVDAAHMLGIAEAPERRLAWNLKALDLAERTPDARAAGWKGSLLNNLGWTYHAQGDYDRALEMFERALAFRLSQSASESTNTVPLQIARWCVARCLRSLGRIDEALAFQQARYEAMQKDGSPGPYVYEELAECLYALNRQEEAKPFFRQAHAELSQDPWLTANEPERLKRLLRLSE